MYVLSWGLLRPYDPTVTESLRPYDPTLSHFVPDIPKYTKINNTRKTFE